MNMRQNAVPNGKRLCSLIVVCMDQSHAAADAEANQRQQQCPSPKPARLSVCSRVSHTGIVPCAEKERKAFCRICAY